MCHEQCALNHDATESAPIVLDVINKPTTLELCISPVYRRLAVAKFSKSTSTNCSRDPDHAHLGSTDSPQDLYFTWPTRVQNLKSLALALQRYYMGCKILKRVIWPWPRPFQGRFFFGRVARAMISQCTKYEVSRFIRYEAVNGGAKCRKWGG